MFYYLSELKEFLFLLNLFKYITFRAGMAAVTTFLICIALGPYFIKKLRDLKIQEIAKRKDCPDLDQFQHSKEGTPTMGGLFVVGSILLSVLLWADLSNRYIILTLLKCTWLAVLGFVDDYVKLTKPKQRGLNKRSKLLWQILLGCFIGSYMYFNPDVTSKVYFPFFKDAVVNLGILYIPFVALVIIGTSNAVNLTDGLDGLAIGCVLIVTLTLAIVSYIIGNVNFSEYLFLPYIRGAGELSVFCAAIIGASLGFLWFNAHPATIFMGDTGSLSLGGTLGVIAVFIKQEILLAIVGGVFVMEAMSVIIQIISVRFRGKKFFKLAPLHHHFQMSGWKESKIIIRFWILAIIFALIALTTLKIR